MLTHPTSERLIALGFTGMATALDEQRQAPDTFDNLGFEDRLGLLVDREAGSATPSGWPPVSSSPLCDKPPASKTSTCAHPAASTAPSWPISSTGAGSGVMRTF